MGSCLSKTSQHTNPDPDPESVPQDKEESHDHDPHFCRCANTTWMHYYLKNGVCKDQLKNYNWKKCIGQAKKEVPPSIMYIGRKENENNLELGTIRPLTGGNANTIVEAIAFHDGKVLCSGSKEYVTDELRRAAGPNAWVQVTLVKGQTLVPGLIEPHVHTVLGAVMHMAKTQGKPGPLWRDFGPFEGQDLREGYNREWLKTQIQTAVDERTRPDDWVLAQGLDPALMPYEVCEHSLNKIEDFSPKTLDGIEANVPLLMLSASGHSAYVNTIALQKIWCAMPEGCRPSWTKFLMRVQNQQGLQELQDISLGFKAIPEEQVKEMCNPEALCNALKGLFEQANKRGVTMLYDAAMTGDQRNILQLYFENLENAPIRLGFAELCAEEEADEVEFDQAPSPLPKECGPFFQAGIKLITDGSNQGLTGYQTEKYRCFPGKYGKFHYCPVEELYEIAKKIKDKGWQIMTHANGNKANDITWKAYKELYDEEESEEGRESFKAKRHRIEHFSLPNKDDLTDMARMGISASFTIGHIGYWGRVFNCAIFEEKAQRLLPCKSALDAGMRITLNSDYPVTPLGPLRLMEQAITRYMEEDPEKDAEGKDVHCPEMGNVLNPAEKLTPAEALTAATYDAAWQCHADGWVGELVERKMADYVILSADPLAVKEGEEGGMRNDIKPLETWVGGIQVYLDPSLHSSSQ